MRPVIKWTIRLAILFLSVDSVIGIADSFGRWDWLEGAMLAHPGVAAVLHGPLFPLMCLGVALLAVYGDKYLKLPSVMARYTNSRMIPNLCTTTLGVVFDSEAKRPGWDKHEIDWYWLVEVRLANESDTPITVEDIRGSIRVGGNKWLRRVFPATRRELPVKHIKDISKFHTSPHDSQPDWQPLLSLLDNIKGVPLTKGIGYRGWLCFSLRATQQDMDGPTLDVWLIDALYGEHRLVYKKDEKMWDKSFNITHDI